MIYLDHNATSPLRPQVVDSMLPFWRDGVGNASSVHAAGSRARCAVETARAYVAALVGAHASEIVFTSGGTEANNLALFGAVRARRLTDIVSTPIEHSSVREPIAVLREQGCRVHLLPVDTCGRVTAAALEAGLAGVGPALVSVGWANNEIGTVQPVQEIAAICATRKATLHVDAVQAAGKIPVHVAGIDLLSLSAHKLGGPQGVGALFVRRGVEVSALLLGGGQERGRRAGTENVAGIAGMGEACRLLAGEAESEARHCAALRDALWHGIEQTISGVRRYGTGGVHALPNTLNVSFAGVRGEALVAALDLEGVAVSSGSACAAGAAEPSHVLLALGCDAEEARDGVRFSLGRTNTAAEIDRVIHLTGAVVRRMRAAAPALAVNG